MGIAIDQADIVEFTDDTNAGSSFGANTTAPVASGGFIVLTISWLATGGVSLSSVSGGGLTWNIDRQTADASTELGCAVVSAQAPSGLASGTALTANLSGSVTGAKSIAGTSFTGVATSSALDNTDLNNPSPVADLATGWTTNSTAIAAGSVLVALACNFDAGSSSTPTAPSIEAHDFNAGPTHFAVTTCYRIETSAGSYTVAGTWSAGVSNLAARGVIAAAYLAAAPAAHPNRHYVWEP